MNQVALVGRLTKDPNFKVISSTKQYTSFILAVNRNFKNKQGNFEADFIPCIAWGRLAETIGKHCGKGSLVGVNGRIHSSSYTNAENKKVYTTDVVIEDIRFYKLKARQFTLQPNQQEEADPILENFEAPAEQTTST